MPATAGLEIIALARPLRAVACHSLSTFYSDETEIALKATFLDYLEL